MDKSVTDEEAVKAGFKSAEVWCVHHHAPEDGAQASRAVLRADYQLANPRLRSEFPQLPGGRGTHGAASRGVTSEQFVPPFSRDFQDPLVPEADAELEAETTNERLAQGEVDAIAPKKSSK